MKTAMRKTDNGRKSRWTLVFAAVLALISGQTVRAADYSYGAGAGTRGFSINGSDWGRDMPPFGTIDNTAGDMAIYWRNDQSAADVTYIHFDLSSLTGKTLTNNYVNLNYTVNANWGGETTGSKVNTANDAWTAVDGSATPGVAEIIGAVNASGSFTTGQTATWQIPRTTFEGYIGSPSYYGLALSGASTPTTAHFSGTPTLTGAVVSPALEVTDATDWSAASWDDASQTLTIGNGTVTGGNVSMADGVKLVVTNDATLGSGSFSGTFDISVNGRLVIATTADQTLSGAISGTGALAKNSSGTLSLTAGSTFSGGITVNGGTLNLPNGDWVTGNPWGPGGMTGGITVGNGATLSTSEGVTQLQNPLVLNGGTVSSRGGYYAGGWGNLTLSTTVLAAADRTSLITSELGLHNGNRTFDVGANGVLRVTGAVHDSPVGGGGIVKTGAGTLKLAGANSYSGQTQIQSGTLCFGDGVTDGPVSGLPGIVNNAALVFETLGTQSCSAPISGSGTLTKRGAGTLTLSGANSYTGETSVEAGTLSVSQRRLSDTAAVRIAADAKLDLNFSGVDVVGALVLDGTTMPAGVYNVATHPDSFSGTGSLVVPQTLTWDNGAATGVWNTSDVNWTGSVWNDSVYPSANFISDATVTLSGDRMGASLSFGTGDANYTGSFSGSALYLAGDLTARGSGANDAGGPVLSFANAVTVDGAVVLGRRNVTVSGGFTAGRIGSLDSWGEFKVADGTCTVPGGIDDGLDGGNTLRVTVSGGTLETSYIRTTQAGWRPSGWNSDGVELNGGVLRATADSGDFIQSRDGYGWGVRNQVMVGPAGGTIDTAGHAITIGQAFVNYDGGGSLTKTGSGTLTLTGSSGVSGGTVANDGTLVLPGYGGWARVGGVLTVNTNGTIMTTGDGTGLGYSGQLKKLVINGGIVTSVGLNHIWYITDGVNMTGGKLQSNSGTDDPNGAQLEWANTPVITSASADSAMIAGRIRIRDEQSAPIAFDVADGAAAADLLVTAYITDAYGNGGIAKSGAGTMVLSRTPAYGSGGTAVDEGTLVVGGAMGALTVAANARVSPGTAVNEVGSLSPSSLTLASGARLLMDVATTDGVCDTITVAGSVDVSGLTVEVNPLGTLSGKNTYVLMTADSISGTPQSIKPDPWYVKVEGNTLVLAAQGTLILIQ